MKVANTRKINERICEYEERNELNELIAQEILEPIEENEIVFENIESLLHNAKHFQKGMMENGFFHSDDESVIAAMIATAFDQFLEEMSWDGRLSDDVLQAIIESGRVFREGVFEDNVYLKNIHLENQRSGKFELTNVAFEKYSLMVYSSPKTDVDGVRIPRIGTFDHQMNFPYMMENGHACMGVTPSEIFSMERPIQNASGDVLTLGCGLGYYACMVAEKDDVNSVTIVEKEPDVIALFTTYILPQIPHREKITILQADALDYMENLEDGRFDHCFADIWSGNNIVPYFKLKNICKKFTRTKMEYWDEDSLNEIIRSYVCFIISEESSKNKGISEEQTFIIPEEGREILDYLTDLLKNEEITRADHVDYYMDSRNILALMS